MRQLITITAVLLAPGWLPAQETGADAREAEVRSVVEQFHAALAAGDSAAAVERLHPDLVVYESGHAESFAEYRSGHLKSDMAFAGAVRREVLREDVVLWEGAALYTAESHAAGAWRGREVDAHGVETMLLTRTPRGWRIRHIHWSSR